VELRPFEDRAGRRGKKSRSLKTNFFETYWFNQYQTLRKTLWHKQKATSFSASAR
jgi:hypothetical protein